jgi:hypothetical protein
VNFSHKTQFLHLAAGAAALPTGSLRTGTKQDLSRRGRPHDGSQLLNEPPTLASHGCSVTMRSIMGSVG